MAVMDIKVPDIGDFKDVAVIEVLVAVGDTIRPEQSLVTVESDKASMEIPASHGGVVKELKVKLGDKVGEGSVLLALEISDISAPVLFVDKKSFSFEYAIEEAILPTKVSGIFVLRKCFISK